MQQNFLQPTNIGSGNAHALKLTFEGKEYNWPKEYITGKELKQLFDLRQEDQLFLEIRDPWRDEPVPDDKEINLARPGIEQFFVKRPLEYTIDKKQFSSDKQYIRGSKIRGQGEIPADYQIFLAIKKPWEDELIRDNDWVDLARPGTEHFYSKKEDVETIIIVNGTAKKWSKNRIEFEDVIILAFGKYIDVPTMVYTVGYEDGPKQNPEGTMTKGEKVVVKNKMIFHATATDRS